MTQPFKTALKYTLSFEGGYVNHPQDKGGPTKYGITQRMAREKGYSGNMKYLRKGFARNVYYDEFWLRVRGDKLWEIDKQLACMVFDFSVTSGIDDACETVQRFVNEHSFMLLPLKIDGNLGRNSRAALLLLFEKFFTKHVIQEFIIERSRFYQKNSQEVFVDGHCSRAQGFNFLRELGLGTVYRELRK